jgi:ribosomal protein S12 methylthiotransferase
MPPPDASSSPTVALLTLGCAKNLVDSEHIAALLASAGVRVIHSAPEADLAIVNTCGFIEEARQESVDLILEVGAGKEAGRPRAVVVTGCLSERYGAELHEALPEADAVIGIDPQGAAQMALRLLGLPSAPLPSDVPLRSHRLTPRGWSYLRIARGCDNRCAYCAIPLIRGPLRSRPMDELLEEARYLVEEGVRELNVIAQDTANYGVDADGERRLHVLLRRLCEVAGLRWLRLLYVHPAHVYDELLDVMAGEEKVCPYLDIPLQHIADPVLARMGRKVTRAEIERLLERLRERVRGLALRTTFMTGFPGETDAHFEELLAFVRQARFERVGCFAYSREEGTPAARLPEQVPAEVAEERRDALMTAQQEIAFELAAARRGERTEVLVEEGGLPEQGLWPARSPREAPDVDPVVLLTADRAPEPGQFLPVEIVGAIGYDCVAEPAEGEGADG